MYEPHYRTGGDEAKDAAFLAYVRKERQPLFGAAPRQVLEVAHLCSRFCSQSRTPDRDVFWTCSGHVFDMQLSYCCYSAPLGAACTSPCNSKVTDAEWKQYDEQLRIRAAVLSSDNEGASSAVEKIPCPLCCARTGVLRLWTFHSRTEDGRFHCRTCGLGCIERTAIPELGGGQHHSSIGVDVFRSKCCREVFSIRKNAFLTCEGSTTPGDIFVEYSELCVGSRGCRHCVLPDFYDQFVCPFCADSDTFPAYTYSGLRKYCDAEHRQSSKHDAHVLTGWDADSEGMSPPPVLEPSDELIP